jgi:outer membrane protein OmpA-like peptidoglycan-associated protein
VIQARRFIVPIVLFALAGAFAGCTKQQSETTAPASPEASASIAAGASASPAAAAGSPEATAGAESSPSAASGTPTPAPTATPVPNLLAPQSGTILRAYPAAVTEADRATAGFSVDANATGPWVFVYELPGTATLSSISAQPPPKTDAGDGSTLTFAVSTTSAQSGFSDVGTIASVASDAVQSSPVNNARARWVRVTVERKGAAHPTYAMGANGTFVSTPSASPAGIYVQYGNPYDAGAFRSAPNENDPWYLLVATVAPNGINGQQCFNGHLGDAYPGTLDGRTWTWKRTKDEGTYVVNDDASLLVGTSGAPTYWVRTTQRPKFCVPSVAGSGKNNVLVLESNFNTLYPTGDDTVKDAPGFRFTHLGAGMVDQPALDAASTVILNGLCSSDDLIAPAQGQAIAQWVQNGHKLLIVDSDMCSAKTHYAMLPYQFVSDNPGAHGAKGDRLIQVEDDSLGTSDKTDKTHFFDPAVYARDGNQLGDANTVTTQDPHWCGHLFGTNVNHVNGFMQMYSLYGKGLIIYDGFDHDDGGVPSYQRLRMLELTQPIPPDLQCTQKASLAFVIQPNRDGSFTPGKPVTLPFTMELLANQGWKGHITMTTSGDFRAAVTPQSFDVNGTTQALKIAVSIPGNAKPGQYAIIVNGDGGNGQNAQATIQLHAAVALVKQLKTQRRIRIYGIHFDVDKATIKPQSEPVIAQIAQVMQQNKAWRFRVEGHTDSDGGLQHNQVLSQHRAESVVNDLVKRYHIAKARLVPVGYGYSKPVAPNTTSAGKALNRRVELFLLNAK